MTETISETTKAALTADQINLVLVLVILVVIVMAFQAWRYSVSMDKLRVSMEQGFNYSRTDQRDGNLNISKLADSVETFSGRMVEITEGFAKRMNTLGQQMDAGFTATSTVIDGMRARLDESDKTANLRNEQVMKAVRDAGDKVIGDLSRHVDSSLDKLAQAVAGSLDVSATGVKDAMSGSLDSLLKRLDASDGDLSAMRESVTQLVVVWGDVGAKLETLRGQMVGKHELDALRGLLDEILTEVRKVKDVQSQSGVEAAAVGTDGAVAAGGAAGDGHPSPVGGGESADAKRDLVLDQHAGGADLGATRDAAGGERSAGGDLPSDGGRPASLG